MAAACAEFKAITAQAIPSSGRAWPQVRGFTRAWGRVLAPAYVCRFRRARNKVEETKHSYRAHAAYDNACPRA